MGTDSQKQQHSGFIVIDTSQSVEPVLLLV